MNASLWVSGMAGRTNAAYSSGADRDRTCDLLHAMQALSQLSYSPILSPRLGPGISGVNRSARGSINPAAPGGKPRKPSPPGWGVLHGPYSPSLGDVL